MRSLSDLIRSVPGVIRVTGDAVITAPVVEDNREVQPGGIFVARPGMAVDGHDFILDAIRRGAAAIVGERDLSELDVPYVQVENAQEATGWLAAAACGHPSRHMVIIGVTGTDGKTTTSTFIHSILQAATGGKAGLVSTVAATIGDQTIDTGFHVTTPGAPQIQAFLARMVAVGLTHCVVEMTSHGLAQGRLNGVDVDVAVLTNLTHEHLDYHGTFENYRAAKFRLFEMLDRSRHKPGQPKISILNADDPNESFFARVLVDRVRRYSLEVASDCCAEGITFTPAGTHFHVEGLPDTFTIHLAGRYNVANALAAISAARALGIDSAHIQTGLAAVQAIPGRMERIDAGQPYTAIVDFAHTPNALENALKAARDMLPSGGRLIAVFGSAGLRDRDKRRLMAEVSARLSDFTVLTAEDPRTESLDTILKTMADAAVAQGAVEGQTFIRVPDRGQALYRACQMARPGDIVIVCGKGHEQSMCFGTIEYLWDDREALRAAIRGSPLRTLPTAPVV
jgi:UDP-N-acetylmuramoyl-L-alanyl-D-glutamate--2,6-diaminopimelate ligase